jgi:WD40 repeat protein
VDGAILLWDLRSGQVQVSLEKGMPAGTRSLSFSPDGRLILAAGGEGQVRVWRFEDGRLHNKLQTDEEDLLSAAFTDDGRYVVTTRIDPNSDDEIVVWQWNLSSGRPVDCFNDPARNEVNMSCVLAAPGGRRILSAGFGISNIPPEKVIGIVGRPPAVKKQYVVQLWHVGTGEIIHTYEGHEKAIRCLAISGGGLRALSGSIDGTVRVWGLPP